MQKPAIQLTAVSKTINNRLILDGIHLTVPTGAIYGISGPNGAGKSMLLRVICGLVYPSQGTVQVLGQQVGEMCEFPDNTGALIGTPGFLPQHSGFRNLALLALIRNQITQDEVREALHQVGLDPDDARPVRQYSTGMRQRLGVAQAIMEKPALLVLDEPTRGIDEQGVELLHRLFMALRSDGTTILLTSHSQSELNTLCDKAFKMRQGKLQAAPEPRT